MLVNVKNVSSNGGKIRVSIKSEPPKINIEAHAPAGFDGYTQYNGEYDVTPKVEAQTLETEKKFLNQNINIKAIPFYEVSNASNGNTIFIAKEL